MNDTLEIPFVLEACKYALRDARPSIMNSDQGSHFTSPKYINTTLQLFKKKISYRTLWCIISLPTKYTKESDPVR